MALLATKQVTLYRLVGPLLVAWVAGCGGATGRGTGVATAGSGTSSGTGGSSGTSGSGGSGGSGGSSASSGSGGTGGGGSCVARGGSCTDRALVCCAGLHCCRGVPLGPGEEYCSDTCPRCAAGWTPVATPTGERPIADLREGDVVLSMDGGRLLPVPIRRASRTPAPAHGVVLVELADGRRLEMSAGHPTADDRTFGDLAPGDRLGDAEVAGIASVPYGEPFTYDILPDSDTGTYVAAGALVGSTLRADASLP